MVHYLKLRKSESKHVTNYRLRRFWYESQFSTRNNSGRYWYVRNWYVAWSTGYRPDGISGRYPVLHALTLNLTLKVKYQVKGHGCVSYSGRLGIVRDHFGTRADAISGRYPVPHALTLNYTLKVKCQVKGHSCLSCSGRLAIV